MEDCKDAPYSEEYYDLLVSYLSLENEYLPEGCIQNIDKDFNVVYLQSAGLPKLDIDQYTYSAIPKCFTILDEEDLWIPELIIRIKYSVIPMVAAVY